MHRRVAERQVDAARRAVDGRARRRPRLGADDGAAPHARDRVGRHLVHLAAGPRLRRRRPAAQLVGAARADGRRDRRAGGEDHHDARPLRPGALPQDDALRAHRPHARLRAARRRRRRRRLLRHPPPPRRRRRPPPPRRRRRHQARPLRGRRPRKSHRRRRGARPIPRAAAAAAAPHDRRGDRGRAARPCVGGGRHRWRRAGGGGEAAAPSPPPGERRAARARVGGHTDPRGVFADGRRPPRADALPVAAARARLGGVARAAAAGRRRRLPPRRAAASSFSRKTIRGR